MDDKGEKTRKRQTNNITLTKDPEMSALIDEFRRAETEDAYEEMAHELQRMVHEDASYIPGYFQPWYRLGSWRWIRFPDSFDLRDSDTPSEYNLYWIDEDIKRETLEAMESGKSFPVENNVYDQWRQD